MRVLIAEDEPTSAFLINQVVSSAGYSTVVTTTGVEALAAFKSQDFDVVLTDWMMPEMDGISLVTKIREHARPGPVILMITAMTDPVARQHALNAGVDGYIEKPVLHGKVLDVLSACLEQRITPVPKRISYTPIPNSYAAPGVAVGIAASTGGPPVLFELIPQLPANMGATYFITQHGPDWTLEMLVSSLQKRTQLPVQLATNDAVIRPNEIYIAPGKRHLTVTSSFRILLCEHETSVGLKPAADPMMESIANAYGDNSIGIVLTGLGRDGSVGGQAIFDVGGMMIAQNPDDAVAPFMPESILTLGLTDTGTKINDIPHKVREAIAIRNSRLAV